MSNNGDDTKAATAEADSIVVDRSCIGCDNCGVGSPQKCCARCGLYYYCSKECQVQHWKQHKSDCTMIKKKHDMWKEFSSKVLPDGTALDTKEGPCAICLEETITNPVDMPCGHVFCFSCVGHYQWSSNKDAACPYCRGEIPDMVERARERAQLYCKRAVASSKGSDDQKKYAFLTIAECDSVVELFDPKEDEELYLNVLEMKALMVSLTDQPKETINVTKEVLLLNEKHPGILDFNHVVHVKSWKAKAYSDCGKWDEAIKSYKSLIRECKQHGGNPGEVILMEYSRALYELRKYDEAIEIGNIVTKSKRHIPGVHKYVALSQKALGDINEAKKTIARAILYEYHWDKDNLRNNKQLLRELNSL